MTAVGSLQAPNYYSSDEEWERCAQDFLGSNGDEVEQTAGPDIELEIQGPDTSEPKVIKLANLDSEPNRYRLFKQIFAVSAIVLIIFAAFIPALAAFFLPVAYLSRRQTAAQNYGNIKDQVTDWTAGAAVVESIKCISPIPKGTYGTPDTTIVKIGLCYLRLVPLGGYARALTGQTIALPAHFVSAALRQNPYDFYCSQAAQSEQIVKFMSWNVNELPLGLGLYFGGSEPNKLDRILTIIKKVNPDLVCLYESNGALPKIAQQLSAIFPFVYAKFGPPTNPFLSDSGILCAARKKPTRVDFIPFKYIQGQQCCRNQGYALLTFDSIGFGAAHLNPGDDDEAASVREAQLQQLIADPNVDCILGDLNIPGCTAEYNASSINQLYDYGSNSCPLTEDTATCTNSLEQVVHKGTAFNPAAQLERIDYILTKVLRNITTFALNIWHHPADKVPSDHKPLVSTIRNG